MQKFDIDPDKVIEECEIIPAGIPAIIELQNDGFAYIKPKKIMAVNRASGIEIICIIALIFEEWRAYAEYK